MRPSTRTEGLSIVKNIFRGIVLKTFKQVKMRRLFIIVCVVGYLNVSAQERYEPLVPRDFIVMQMHEPDTCLVVD